MVAAMSPSAKPPGRLRPLPLLALTSLLASPLLAGCSHSRPPEISRVLDGEARTGPYIAPESYESFVRAEMAFEAGEWEVAIEGYRRALEGSGGDPVVAGRLAESLARAGAGAEADETIEEGLRAHPDAEALWMSRGRIEERRLEPTRALAAFERAMLAAPRSEEPPLALARLMLRSKPAAEVDARLDALEVETSASPDALLRARLLVALQSEDAVRAAEIVDAIASRGTIRRNEIAAAAELALASGRRELAARLIDLAPSDEEHAELRARIYRAVGRDDEADSLLIPDLRANADRDSE